MSVCVTTNYLDPHSFYPVLDPRRTAGPGPYLYGYGFAWDGVVVGVQRTAVISQCEMTVVLISRLAEQKEIQAWNFFRNSFVDRISSAGNGQPVTMTLRRSGSGGQACGDGTSTIVLCRYFGFPRGRTALYTFPPDDFWAFWGGCKVTFEWVTDTAGSNLWGSQTPAPVYPSVRLPDGTLMRDSTGFSVVFGGTSFTTDAAYRTAMGLATGSAVPFRPLPSLPADGTLLREQNHPEVFVVYGGAKFWIPDPATLFALGFDFSRVRVIPDGGTGTLRTVPIDGTFVREQSDPRVYVVHNGQLRWVTSPAAMDGRCFAWGNVRLLPDGSTAGLARGADLGPP